MGVDNWLWAYIFASIAMAVALASILAKIAKITGATKYLGKLHYWAFVAAFVIAGANAWPKVEGRVRPEALDTLLEAKLQRCASYLTAQVLPKPAGPMGCNNLIAYRRYVNGLDRSRKIAPPSLQPFNADEVWGVLLKKYIWLLPGEHLQQFIENLLIVAALFAGVWIAKRTPRKLQQAERWLFARIDAKKQPAEQRPDPQSGALSWTWMQWEDVHVEHAGPIKLISFYMLLPLLIMIGAVGAYIAFDIIFFAYKPPNRPSDVIFYVMLVALTAMCLVSLYHWRRLYPNMNGNAFNRRRRMAAWATTDGGRELRLKVTMDGELHALVRLSNLRNFALETYANHYGEDEGRPPVFLILADLGRGETEEVAQSFTTRAAMAQLMARFIRTFLEGPVAEAVAKEREHAPDARVRRSPAASGSVDDVI